MNKSIDFRHASREERKRDLEKFRTLDQEDARPPEVRYAKDGYEMVRYYMEKFRTLDQEDARPPEVRYAKDGYELVRYYIGSNDMRTDIAKFAFKNDWKGFRLGEDNSRAHFGLRRLTDGAIAAFIVVDPLRRDGALMTNIYFGNYEGDRDSLIAAVKDLGLPPGGFYCEREIMAQLNAVFDPVERWKVIEPTYVMVVTFTRAAYWLHPIQEETRRIVVPCDPALDTAIASEDKNAAYFAREVYRERAFDLIPSENTDNLFHFSSWIPHEEVERVKVLDPKILEAIEAAMADMQDRDDPAPSM